MLATSVIGALAIGWLDSGSCTVAACYEDCDPCFETCHCQRTCSHALAGAAAYRIVACEQRTRRESDSRVVKSFTHVIGPSLELALGPDPHTEHELAAFAVGVLEENRAFVTSIGSARWVLDAVERYETAGVVNLHQDLATASDGARSFLSNSASLLFDRSGNLLEIEQVLERAGD